jgi:hypothetical protein
MRNKRKGNYYLARKTQLLKRFDQFSTAVKEVLASQDGEDEAE